MDTTHEALRARLAAYEFAAVDAALPLPERLARDNGWTRARTERVLEEYRRFVFLAMTAEHPLTPSDDVDQAWHLHLLYTREYWEHFCPEVLGAPLHHQPTRGGAAEREKFVDWYERTLAAYRRTFGGEPPADIWPPAAERFARAARVRRVDTGRFLVLERRRWATAGAAAAALSGLVVSARLAFAAVEEEAGASGSLVWVMVVALIVVVGLVCFALVLTRPRSEQRGKNGGSDGSAGGFAFCGPGEKHGSGGKSDGGGGAGGGGDGGGGGGCGGGGGA